MLKAQVLRHLHRVPSNRRLALLLKTNRRTAKACGFRPRTPSHGLFTQFRQRLGKIGYEKVFSMLLMKLLKNGAVKGTVVALDSTAVKAHSQRSRDAHSLLKGEAPKALAPAGTSVGSRSCFSFCLIVIGEVLLAHSQLNCVFL